MFGDPIKQFEPVVVCKCGGIMKKFVPEDEPLYYICPECGEDDDNV